MGSIKFARAVAGRAKPLLKTAREVEDRAKTGGQLAVLAGAPKLTAALERLLGIAAGRVPGDGALLVYAAGGGADTTAAAETLSRHKSRGGRVCALLVGGAEEHGALEAIVLAAAPLELSDTVRVESLAGDGGDAARTAVILALGDDAVAAGRANVTLREPVARLLIDRASKRSAAVGAAGFLPGAEFPVLLAQQVRLVSQLSALHDRPAGRARTAEIAGVVAAGYGWRALARRATSRVPGAGLALRSGFAYGATRSAGEAALKTFSGAPKGAAPRKRTSD